MNIQKIEDEIKKLPPNEMAKFRSWFEKFDAEVWDTQIESDAKSGKLKQIAEIAIKDFKNGKNKPF
jgi:hypothetical protein